MFSNSGSCRHNNTSSSREGGNDQLCHPLHFHLYDDHSSPLQTSTLCLVDISLSSNFNRLFYYSCYDRSMDRRRVITTKVTHNSQSPILCLLRKTVRDSSTVSHLITNKEIHWPWVNKKHILMPHPQFMF